MEPRDLGISPVGEEELYHIGQRLRKRVPELLPSHISERDIQLRCTDTERSKLSARSFLQGLFEHKGKFKIEGKVSHLYP